MGPPLEWLKLISHLNSRFVKTPGLKRYSALFRPKSTPSLIYQFPPSGEVQPLSVFPSNSLIQPSRPRPSDFGSQRLGGSAPRCSVNQPISNAIIPRHVPVRSV